MYAFWWKMSWKARLLNSLNQQYRQQQNAIYVDSSTGVPASLTLKLEMHFPAGEELLLVDSLSLYERYFEPECSGQLRFSKL